ncbi:S1/P1 Nuclease [Mucilaginibacter sp. PPCGB 2223]|uniref:zinc dependent phospholipase C family protein n=1 Tax=Mucilaginibacter sp. PPCGB 2223 TaxID=1886027 RepID=UPI0008262F91|nr:zinc dependent phospholipase C family protein [Mucilaginibacter sp. PPCGB 2223]OCX54605.1 S1/P1 Nuclease [Mucilaginibacter sp. PPCGB 2223]
MKQKLALLLLCITTLTLCCSWGFFGHRRINRIAVFTLPKGMAGFYKANIDFITEHAVDPDKKRYVDSSEGPKHFIDADHYGKNPFAKIPERWAEAERQYSADSLDKYGTVPWTIQHYYYKLVDAFKRRDTTDILHTSANLGHYIADANVPLHTTMNYNGQMTHQEGIHALWETRVVELFSDGYNYHVPPAHYIQSPLKEAWKMCRRSFKCVDSVLVFEKQLSATFTDDKKYGQFKRGNRKVKDYTVEYAEAYQKMLHGMVERQMRLSVMEVGNFWFTAWVDAGQPNLDKLIATPLTSEQKQKLLLEETSYKTGKVVALSNK